MRIAFYLTNHGYGHASRNVPIVLELLRRVPDLEIYLCSDEARIEFLQRNFVRYGTEKERSRIVYRKGITETGLVLRPGTMEPDLACTKARLLADYDRWEDYLAVEESFLREQQIDLVVADIVAWALKAAHRVGIPGILIGNFSWAQMYRGLYDETTAAPYVECYSLATKAFWYAIHAEELEHYCKDNECVSLITRESDPNEVRRIREGHRRPIVLVSLGASAEIERELDVSRLPYDFLTTRGVHLKGENVYPLPEDMVNTPDYVRASDYIIAKGGWSTVAEIFLAHKKSALLLRGNNPEDNTTYEQLSRSGRCVILDGAELKDIREVLESVKRIDPSSIAYTDDANRICDEILRICGRD